MWLLDANLDIHLVDLLRGCGIGCDTAENRGWKAVQNGELVAEAAAAGFDALLARDQLFAESASRAWRAFPRFGVVVVRLPQLSSIRYLEAFEEAWRVSPIQPQPGKMVFWP